jgi:inner membrane protein
VFIVEPWLWVVAIPPLLLVVRSRLARLALGAALVLILAAAWRVDMVGRGVAAALTLGALAWGGAMVAVRASRRVSLALVAWLAVESVFFAARSSARASLRAATSATARDVIVNPAVGDPLCFHALVVELKGGTYSVTSAAVATVPPLRSAARCGTTASRTLDDAPPSTRPATRAVRWGREWSAPRAELAALAAANCEVAAAPRFMRVPAWRRTRDGGVELYDLRYGAGGFADVVAPARPRECPRPVPPWEPPRRDVLGG